MKTIPNLSLQVRDCFCDVLPQGVQELILILFSLVGFILILDI